MSSTLVIKSRLKSLQEELGILSAEISEQLERHHRIEGAIEELELLLEQPPSVENTEPKRRKKNNKEDIAV